MQYGTLTRVNPWGELASLKAEVDRLINDGSLERAGSHVCPAVDVLRSSEHIIVRADMPGLTRDSIEITILNNRLFIQGEKKPDVTSNTQTEQRTERRFGSFERVVNLPGRVNPEAVKARLTDGVLEVIAPLQAEAKPRQIPLEVK